MLNRLDLRGVKGDLAGLLPRPGAAKESPLEAVRSIIAEVRARGDAAVLEHTKRFDGASLGGLRVPPAAVIDALGSLPAPLRMALEEASAAITDFHSRTRPEPTTYRRDGVEVRVLRRPVGRAGLYAPGGRARYPSTVLMTAIPARVAGVPEVVLCVPPDVDGSVNAPTLAAAALAGVDEVYSIGGAQAVAAMAYGTESVTPVDVIVGPGNVYVSLAKREVAGLVGVPSAFAGPSEVVVVADETTPAELAAIDLMVQAEHGPDGLAWLVTWSERVAVEVGREIAELAASSPRRAEIESTLGDGGYTVLVDSPERAMEVANAVAPEHLQLMTRDPESLLPMVASAGAVFLGLSSPASVGDYIAGPSHVLPTDGSARFASALGVDDFSKEIHVVSLDEAALSRVGSHVAVLAEAEGLLAHAESIRIRGAVR